MLDIATTIGIAGVIIGAISVVLTIKFRTKPKATRRRSYTKRKQDPTQVSLDLTKPDLGLTDEKIKKIGIAWFLNRLIENKGSKRDAI